MDLTYQKLFNRLVESQILKFYSLFPFIIQFTSKYKATYIATPTTSREYYIVFSSIIDDLTLLSEINLIIFPYNYRSSDMKKT